MTEKEFKQKCKKEKIKGYCYITKNQFLNKPNIVGCNKIDTEFIIYFTNSRGSTNELCHLNDENYAFDFIYNLLLFAEELTIDQERNAAKIKKLKL